MELQSVIGHDIVPTPDTVRRADGQPGSILRPLDYPLVAACLACGRTVRCETYFMSDWYHIDGD
jgi:hypothetical protein